MNANLAPVLSAAKYQEGEVQKMKKTLLLSIALAGAVVLLPAVETKAADKSSAASAATQSDLQQRRRGWNNRRWGGQRTYLQTRTVRRGRFMYRETYRVTTRNGRIISNQLVSRTRLYRA